MNEDEEKIEGFSIEDVTTISQGIDELIVYLCKETKAPSLPILLSIWSSLNLSLRKIDKENLEFEIQGLMNRVNICHSRILKEQ